MTSSNTNQKGGDAIKKRELAERMDALEAKLERIRMATLALVRLQRYYVDWIEQRTCSSEPPATDPSISPDEAGFERQPTRLQRLLYRCGIFTLGDLTQWSEKELLCGHGIGASDLVQLRRMLSEHGLQFKDD